VTGGALCWLLLAAALALLGGPAADGPAGGPAPDSGRRRGDEGLPLALDLAAAALRCGRDVAGALRLAAGPLDGRVRDRWQRVAALLDLGADPVEAWTALAADPVLAPVAAAACRSATSGARLAGAFAQLAVELRAQQRAAALARAHRAGVVAMAPLGLCFLPAFVCLGIVPTVAGIAAGVLGSIP
jgi:pilus assembly protein TadC